MGVVYTHMHMIIIIIVDIKKSANTTGAGE